MASLRGAELLFFCAAEAGGGPGKQGDCQDWQQSGVPGLVGEGVGREHQAGGDDGAGQGSGGSGGAELENDESEEKAEADGPDGDSGGLRGPPVGLEDQARRREGQDEEQDQLRLPVELGLRHRFIVSFQRRVEGCAFPP